MTLEVLLQYLDEPCFNQLRTIEQLGYVVFSMGANYRDVMGARFLVQSSQYSCDYIVNSLHNFIQDYWGKVQQLTEEEFKVQVQAVVTRVSEKDYNLNGEADRLFAEITTHKYIFNRKEKQVEILQTLTKQDIVDMYQKLLISSESKRIDVMLNSQTHTEMQAEWKAKNNEALYKEKPRTYVEETPAQFKLKMELYPDVFKANYANAKM